MDSSELYISYFFYPNEYVSGINVLKRIIENERKVDVLHKKENNSYPDFLNEYINNHINVDIDCDCDYAFCIFEFMKKGLKTIENDYEKIYSRSWLMANHFLACEYKFKKPDTFWSAEFSDPLIYNLSNKPKKYKEMIIDNKAYIDKINTKIKEYNEIHNTSFEFVENNTSAYFICEYITYLFADRLIFTNENQREIMLNQFPADIKEHIIGKSEVKMHSLLPQKFYYLKNHDLKLERDSVNIAYFGNDYYGKRHFESLFYAVESLNHTYKDKLHIDLYISDDKLVKKLIKPLKTSNLFSVKKPLNYFEFLNASTQYDVLIVNDVITQDNYKINPYLPSKLSDYLNSGSYIWAFYEKNSSLSKFNLKFKSEITDFNEGSVQLAEILNIHGYPDNSYSINDDYIFSRLTTLNELYESEFRRKRTVEKSRLNKLIDKLKK